MKLVREKARVGFLTVLALAVGMSLTAGRAQPADARAELTKELRACIELMQAGQGSAARTRLVALLTRVEAALRANGKDAQILFMKGEVHFLLEDDAKAHAAYARAAELAPKNALYRFKLGVALLYLKRNNEAAESIRRAHEMEPGNQDYFFGYCDVTERAGQHEAAIACYRRLLVAFPKHTRALARLAAALEGRGREEEAIQVYQALLAHDPRYKDAHFNLGQLLQRAEKHREALPHFRAHLEVSPEDWGAVAKLVQIHSALNEPEKAEEARLRVLAAFRRGKIKEERFCREQWRRGSLRIFAFEYFEMKGPWAVRYLFALAEPSGRPRFHISLGSYERTNQLAREQGTIKPGERLFHLDFYQNGSHRTLGWYKGEVGYPAVRTAALAEMDRLLGVPP